MIESLDQDFIKILGFTERPFRAKFIPKKIYRDVDAYKNNVDGLFKYLRKYKIVRELSPLDESITVGGEFDEEGQMVIRLFGDFNSYQFTDGEWAMFKFRLLQCMMHELIHWHQFYARGHSECKVYEYVSEHEDAPYYSSSDEVSAFAHCIFLELKREYPQLPISESIESYGGETYNAIFKDTFDHNFDNKALKRYVNEILRWEKKYK